MISTNVPCDSSNEDLDMISPEIKLSFDQTAVYRCGAALLSIVACAEVDAANTRQAELYASLCGRALWAQHLAHPDNLTPITVMPQNVFRDIRVIDRDVGFVAKRLGERLVAGRMAVPFLLAAELGRVPRLPRGVRRLSLNEMAAFVLNEAGLSDPNNLKRRIWRPSAPVIHLAAAMAVVGQERIRSGMQTSLELFLLSADFVRAIIQRAQLFADLIDKAPKFPVEAERLIRLAIA
jgi:hypothetical protein